MKRILVAAASVAIAAFPTLAADADYTAETGYVTVNKNGGNWIDADTWSSGIRPVDLTVATNYYIGTSYKVSMLKAGDVTAGYGDVKFPADGSTLVVAGGRFGWNAGCFLHRSGGDRRPWRAATHDALPL